MLKGISSKAALVLGGEDISLAMVSRVEREEENSKGQMAGMWPHLMDRKERMSY